MHLSRQETEILRELSKDAVGDSKVNTVDSLARHLSAQQFSEDEISTALERLQGEGFVEIAESGNILSTEKGNAALSSL